MRQPAVVEADEGRAWPLLQLLRPRQWTKNLAVFAPLLFSRSVFHPGALLRATAAVVCFCLLAGGVYVFNDWVDRERDRLHPDKRHRALAAGLVSANSAFALGAAFLVTGLILAGWLGVPFARVALAYIFLQFLYTAWLKRFVILDVVVIALGFVVRVAGGGVAISVPVSNWLYLCTLLLAVFLGFAKRRHELASLQGGAAAHRSVLQAYSLPLLDQLISVVAASCILSYGLYSVASETVEKVGSDRMKYTVPCVMYGIFRYLYLIHREQSTGSPERVLLGDWPILATVLLFVALASWALYGGAGCCHLPGPFGTR
jgi:4-hydroxybenzoate polyprenyltransferase